LEASDSIVVDKAKNSVRMIDKRYIPFGAEIKTENAKVGMAAVGNLVDTIAYNLKAASKDKEAFYQQGCWTNRLNKKDSEKLREIARKFLLKTDERARKMMKPFEQDAVGQDQVTAGISMFYFEEKPQDVS
jgi:hypothetical protein